MKRTDYEPEIDERFFETAEEGQAFAKANPGMVMIREGDGFVVYGRANAPAAQADTGFTPRSVKAYLDRHVIGQEDAKTELALALFSHRDSYERSGSAKEPNEGPLMLVGPTGSGKTFMVQKACELIDLPFVHVNAAAMVPEGIVGVSISEIVDRIETAAKGDEKKASHAVVFLDEIDKLFHENSGDYGDRVVHQLLRFIEGEYIEHKSGFGLDSSTVQFILGGAFSWLRDDDADTVTVQPMGFIREAVSYVPSTGLSPESLMHNGVPPEILGRVRSIVNLEPLDGETYYRILTQSESSPLRGIVAKIERYGDRVQIDDDVLRFLSEAAARSPFGVRALHQMLKKLLKEALFKAPEPGRRVHRITSKDIIFNIE